MKSCMHLQGQNVVTVVAASLPKRWYMQYDLLMFVLPVLLLVATRLLWWTTRRPLWSTGWTSATLLICCYCCVSDGIPATFTCVGSCSVHIVLLIRRN
ncbi:hypothetical protein OWV82_000674 [Melia azedarach]|uniref:Uncharacterized protein n=1 Tax=Melia azedarach TaxID=155640 RepID=A0ACC1YW62_MELAZ|nr:hypothetical protein OWV82_000674 [Melia azedarach]